MVPRSTRWRGHEPSGGIRALLVGVRRRRRLGLGRLHRRRDRCDGCGGDPRRPGLVAHASRGFRDAVSDVATRASHLIVTYPPRQMTVTIDDVRALAAGLPRSYEVVVRGRVKFRVGQIVYLAFSKDETQMGF